MDDRVYVGGQRRVSASRLEKLSLSTSCSEFADQLNSILGDIAPFRLWRIDHQPAKLIGEIRTPTAAIEQVLSDR